jgi:hypothetical protein
MSQIALQKPATLFAMPSNTNCNRLEKPKTEGVEKLPSKLPFLTI